MTSIRPATAADIPRVVELFTQAIAFQRQGGHPAWSAVDPAVIRKDLGANALHVLASAGTVIGVFSYCTPSPVDHEVWAGRSPASARYLNRIIVDRACKGRELFKDILAWSECEALREGIALLRLVTWQDSPPLIDYYRRFGFRLLGTHTTSVDASLPPTYRGLRLVAMEKPQLSCG